MQLMLTMSVTIEIELRRQLLLHFKRLFLEMYQCQYHLPIYHTDDEICSLNENFFILFVNDSAFVFLVHQI